MRCALGGAWFSRSGDKHPNVKPHSHHRPPTHPPFCVRFRFASCAPCSKERTSGFLYYTAARCSRVERVHPCGILAVKNSCTSLWCGCVAIRSSFRFFCFSHAVLGERCVAPIIGRFAFVPSTARIRGSAVAFRRLALSHYLNITGIISRQAVKGASPK